MIYAVPSLVKSPKVVFKKLFSALNYRGDKIVSLEGGTLLSSIGVLPEAQGKSVGRALLEAFEVEAFSKGSSYIYLITDATDNDTVNNFYKKYQYSIESTFLQSGGRRMYRYIKYNSLSSEHNTR
ncbi:GNAT family N-acetyltransferase [Castellaniella sp. FW104-16D08]